MTSSSELYSDPPPSFFPKARVAVVVALIDNRILLLQRVASHPHGNLWCSPGGRIENHETEEDAALRELREETGLQGDPKDLEAMGIFFVRFPHGDFALHLYRIHINGIIQIQNSEHQRYRLCSLEEAKTMPLQPGQLDCLLQAMKSS